MEESEAGGKHRVLIISASAGTGHVKAATALEKVCLKREEIGEVHHIDALEYTTKLFHEFYSKLYIQVVRRAPTFFGWLYDTSDEPWKTEKMRLMLDRLNTGALVRRIKELKPDVTICTHFLPAEIISYLISKNKLQTKLAIVVTDFDAHAMWLSRVFHHYFVALEETKVHLQFLGIPEERITISGIPVDPVFSERRDRGEVRKELGLQEEGPVLLLSAGAFGVGPADGVVEVLFHLKTAAQVVVICGRNEALKLQVEKKVAEKCPPHLSFHALGFTDRMAAWMSAADLFIGKPGGLTTAEALCKKLPMVVFSPIPGQEERNSDHLLEQGAAIKCNQVTTMAFKLDRLLADKKKLQAMREAAEELGAPGAAEEIVDTLINTMGLEAVRI